MTRTDIRRRLGRALSVAASLATVAVAAVLVVPKLTGHELYAITSGSMTGTADVGSLVISQPVPVDRLAVGDVITYVPPTETGIAHLVTHRIAAIDADVYGLPTFTTKGDANAAADPWVFQLDQAVQPRMRWGVPLLGWPVLWLADRTVRMAAVGIPALLVALAAARDLVRGLRRPDRAAPDDLSVLIDLADPVLVLDDPTVAARP